MQEYVHLFERTIAAAGYMYKEYVIYLYPTN